MKFKVENLGTLKKAEIDLSKDLIILAGPNNSGKTYLAYSIYGVYQTSNIPLHPNFALEGFELDNIENKDYLEIDLKEFYSVNNASFNKLFCEVFLSYMPYIFGLESDTRFFNSTKFSFQLSAKKLIDNLYYAEKKWTQFYGNVDFTINLFKEPFTTKIKVGCSTKIPTEKKEIVKRDIISVLQDVFVQNFPKNNQNTIFFPAERIATNVFSKELSIKRNHLVDEMLSYKDRNNKNPLSLLERRAKRYPLPIRDSLEIAEDLETLQKSKSDFAFLGEMIEKELLKGKITVSENGEMNYVPKGTKTNLEVHLTGSMVKSLASIVFYLKHLAQKNDLLIIDEPELNLHPDNQRLVAKILVRLVNEGFKVIISTHSDYLIRELNNLMMLKSSEKPEVKKLMKKYNYQENDLLDYKKVGAYLFKENENTELEVNETGFEVDTINEEINRLNNTAQEIFFTLYD